MAYIAENEGIKSMSRDLANAAKKMTAAEARFLVNYYYICQENRIRTSAQVRTLNDNGDPVAVLEWLTTQDNTLENQVKRALDKYTDDHKIGSWIKSLYGFGPVLSAGLIAHLDIHRAPTAGHFWSYAGFVPDKAWVSSEDAKHWVKENGVDVAKAARYFMRNYESMLRFASTTPDGEQVPVTERSLAAAIARRPWNAQLKTLMFKVGESLVKFAKHEDCYYGHIYRARKEREWRNNMEGVFQHVADKDVKRYSKTTESYAWVSGQYKANEVYDMMVAGIALTPANLKKIQHKAGEGDKMIPPAHIHARARRYAGKIFLSHLHEVWFETEFKRAAPAPYLIEHQGHTHRIRVPNYKSPYQTYPEVDFQMDAKYLKTTGLDDGLDDTPSPEDEV